MDEDEHILAKRLAENDDRAWESFCRQYSGPLLGIIRLRFDCPQEMAEEVVHLAFIRCVKSIGKFDPKRGRLFDWLKAIAANEARTLYRKDLPQRQIALDPQDQDWLEQVDQTELPPERLQREEVRLLILETLMSLNTRHRQALMMKYFENRRVADMARLLGESEKAVESLLTRSRLALKELLTRRFKEPVPQQGGTRL